MYSQKAVMALATQPYVKGTKLWVRPTGSGQELYVRRPFLRIFYNCEVAANQPSPRYIADGFPYYVGIDLGPHTLKVKLPWR